MSDPTVFDDQPTRCPRCGHGQPIPIIYGAASQEMLIAARLGEIVIAEETPPGPAPFWACPRGECGLKF